MPLVSLSDLDCKTVAMSLRLGADRERAYAAAQSSVATKAVHERAARYHEELAEKFQEAGDSPFPSKRP